MNYFGHKIINGFRSHTPRGFYDLVKGHTGIDLSCPVGTDLQLPIVTTAVDFKNQAEMGNTLYLRDSDGNTLVFAHLTSISVKIGDIVSPGTVFAKTGNTGRATTGAHLHFEIIAQKPEVGLDMMTRRLGNFKGYNIDPVSYLDSLTLRSSEGLDWLRKHEIIFGEHRPTDPVTWGELGTVLHRLTRKILEWVKNPQ